MKKILVSSLLLLLAACSNGGNDTSKPQSDNEIETPKFEEFVESYSNAEMGNTSLLCNAGSLGCETGEIYVKYDGDVDYSTQFEESKKYVSTLTVTETEKPQPLGNMLYRLSVNTSEDDTLYLNVYEENICAVNNGKGNKYTTWYQMSDEQINDLVKLIQSYANH